MQLAIKSMLAGTLLLLGSSTSFGQSVPEATPKQAAVRQMQVQIQLLSEAVEDSRMQARKMAAELNATGEKLAEINVSEGSFDDLTRLLQTQRVELMIELAGLEAREQKLIELRDETGAQTQLQQDEVIVLLEQMVDKLTEKQEMLQKLFVNQRIPASEVESGEIMVLQAKLKLAEAKAERPKQPRSDELTEIAVERIDKRARLQMVEMLLKKYYEARNNVTSIQQLKTSYESELQRTMALEDRLQQLELDLQMMMNQPD